MPFTVPNAERTLRTKDECLELWALESARFKRLFKAMSPQHLASAVKSGTCGHTYGQHIPCMLGWMEAARDYFKARLSGKDKPFRDYEAETMLEYTNRLISELAPLSTPIIWARLEQVETEYRAIITELPLERLFTNKDGHAWDHFIWSTFGHYAEHSDELEWQFSGRPGVAPERSYGFSFKK